MFTEKRRFEDIASFQMGINKGRLKNSNKMYFYNNTDMSMDLQHDDNLEDHVQVNNVSTKNRYTLSSGDIIYSLVTNKISVVSHLNIGKILDQNFIRVSINNRIILPRYLCYYINENSYARHQLNAIRQGTVIQKVSLSELARLIIECPSLENQSIIGGIYFNLNVQKKYNDQLYRNHMDFIEQKMKTIKPPDEIN